jgi:ABC-type polysaccharide/polyol phosphate transport system ATPase subunit
MSSGSSDGAAVRVAEVSKTFSYSREAVHTLKERALHPLRRRPQEEIHALRSVDLEVERGEFFGIVGRNGSGKSTLMKCIAGIYGIDEGHIFLRGRLAPFIELGVGFNPDLTARDNVSINAIMLGLTPAQARDRYDSIIEFAELEEFQDLKLKNYSSGMQVRLAFAVMVHVDADILLIDEVLAVGDASFQQKCHDALQAARDESRTVLLVTHDMNAVQRFCDRAVLLEEGHVVELGEPRAVCRHYEQLNFQKPQAERGPLPAHLGDGSAAIGEAWFEDEHGTRTAMIAHDAGCAIGMRVTFRDPVEDPVFGAVVTDERHRVVFAATSASSESRSGSFAAGDEVTVRLRFHNVLASGRYFASPQVAYRGTGHRLMDHREDAASTVVRGGREGAGTVDLPHSVEITAETAPAGEAARA